MYRKLSSKIFSSVIPSTSTILNVDTNALAKDAQGSYYGRVQTGLKLVGKSRSSISNQLRLLELPEEIQIALVTKKLSQGHAKALLAMADNPEQQMILFSLIKDENISVRLAEEISRKGKRKKKRTKPTYSLSDDQSQALDMIKLRFSQKVKLIKTSNKTGKIEIRFDSNEELESFLIKLTN